LARGFALIAQGFALFGYGVPSLAVVGWNLSSWLVDRHVDAGHGEAIAFRHRGETLRYTDVQARSQSMAAGLQAQGLGPGDRIGVVMLDTPATADVLLGAWRIGALPVLVNPLLPTRDVAGILEGAKPALVVVSSERRPQLADLADVADAAPGPVMFTDTPGFQSLYARDRPFTPCESDESTPAFWLCTGGSTGRPKLAVHRHGDVQLTVEAYASGVLGLTAADRCFSVGPMFHAYGLGNSLTFPLALGASAVLEPTRPPTPALVAQIIGREQPSLFFAIPTFYAALVGAAIPDDTFAGVRHAVSAAEPLPAETWRRFRDRFGVEILDGIGSTELLHIFISNRPGRVRPGTSGEIVAPYDAKVVDDEGRAVPDGSAGHLQVRGDSAAIEYAGQPELSARTFGADGWVRTGDTYQRDADGYYTYLGRSDDMLRVAGEWVSPAEVEAVIIEHAGVLEVAVVGRKGDLGVTQVVAHVVPRSDATLRADDVIEHCHSRLAGYKRPKHVVIRDSLPKTATGKIQRYLLRD